MPIPSDRLIGDVNRTIQQSRQQTEQQRAQECWPGPDPVRPFDVLRWMCLTQDLAAASVPTKPPTSSDPTIPSTATANPVEWIGTANSGTGGYYVDTDSTFNVQEGTGDNSYNNGQWVLCRSVTSDDGEAWEPVAQAIPRTIFGTLAATLSAGGTANANVTKTLNGSDPTGTVQVKDSGFGILTGDSGDYFMAIEDSATGDFVLQSVLSAQTVVTDWQYDTGSHKFQVKTRDTFVTPSAAETSWTDSFAAVEISQVQTDTTWSSPTLAKNTVPNVYVLEQGTPAIGSVVDTAQSC